MNRVIQIHFVGVPKHWKAMALWITRIFVILLIVIPSLAYLAGDDISVLWVINEVAVKLLYILLPILTFLLIILPAPLVVSRVLLSFRYCRKYRISITDFYKQDSERIIEAWKRR